MLKPEGGLMVLEEREIVTWSRVRNLKIRKNREYAGLKTLGEYLDALNLEELHGRKELTEFDKNKLMHLMLRDDIELKRGSIDGILERGSFGMLEDITKVLTKYLNARGLLARPVTFMVDLGDEYLEEKTLEELRLLKEYGLYSIRLNLKGKKYGKYEINLDYVLDLNFKENPITSLVVDFIRTDVWYATYLDVFLDNICLNMKTLLDNLDAVTYCLNNKIIEDTLVDYPQAEVVVKVVEDIESIKTVFSYR